jgi:hypothetical protein
MQYKCGKLNQATTHPGPAGQGIPC